jgi:predicted lipoprotein with Yx(FWY)xxD motif
MGRGGLSKGDHAMKNIRILVAIFGLLALLVLPAAAMHHEVKVADKTEIGKYLTDSEGKTLYWFKKDSTGKSACAGTCVDNWPIFYREKVASPSGLNADDFGTITREDGARQSTFRGYPLYYYKGDTTSGDTRGNDLMGIWYVVDPANFPPK